MRKFVDRELIPLEREYRPDSEGHARALLKPLQEKAKAIGLWMLDVPPNMAAPGSDLMPRCIIHGRDCAHGALPFRSLDLRPGSAAGTISLQRRAEETISSTGIARRN